MPGTVNTVRGGNNVTEVPFLREEQDIDQLVTSYEVSDDIHFPSFPRVKLETHSIRNRSSQMLRQLNKGKKDQM